MAETQAASPLDCTHLRADNGEEQDVPSDEAEKHVVANSPPTSSSDRGGEASDEDIEDGGDEGLPSTLLLALVGGGLA